MSGGEMPAPALACAEGPLAPDAYRLEGQAGALEAQGLQRAAGPLDAPAAAASATDAAAAAEG